MRGADHIFIQLAEVIMRLEREARAKQEQSQRNEVIDQIRIYCELSRGAAEGLEIENVLGSRQAAWCRGKMDAYRDVLDLLDEMQEGDNV